MAAGHLTITEYRYTGEVTPSVPLEPSTRIQRVAIGEVSEPMHSDTHLVTLYANLPCRFAFFVGDEVPTEGTPITENYEITRHVHTGTRMSIAVLEQTF